MEQGILRKRFRGAKVIREHLRYCVLIILLTNLDNSNAAELDRRPVSTSHFTESNKIKDELRCHCNLPLCVTTGYMCKSARGTCFSETVDFSDYTKSRHGCIELLSSEKAEICTNQSSRDDSSQRQKLGMKCCEEDLCNFAVQQHDLRTYAAVKIRNDSNGIPLIILDQVPVTSGSSGIVRDQWLKAATIAVPLAGGFILVLLVLLAVRMLRKDRDYDSWSSDRDFYVWSEDQQLSSGRKDAQQQPMLSNNSCSSSPAVYLCSPVMKSSQSQKTAWKNGVSSVYNV